MNQSKVRNQSKSSPVDSGNQSSPVQGVYDPGRLDPHPLDPNPNTTPNKAIEQAHIPRTVTT